MYKFIKSFVVILLLTLCFACAKKEDPARLFVADFFNDLKKGTNVDKYLNLDFKDNLIPYLFAYDDYQKNNANEIFKLAIEDFEITQTQKSKDQVKVLVKLTMKDVYKSLEYITKNYKKIGDDYLKNNRDKLNEVYKDSDLNHLREVFKEEIEKIAFENYLADLKKRPYDEHNFLITLNFYDNDYKIVETTLVTIKK